nr:helix-turn-helix transcriptional regulator [Brevundimonas naejangsanensis]
MGLHNTAKARPFVLGLIKENDCSEAWSKSCSRAAMIITPSLHLLWCNEEGRRLLDIDQDLGEVGSRLSFSQRTGVFAFAAFLENLGDEPRAWVLARRDGGGNCLIIRAVRITLGDADAFILAFSDTAGSRQLWADFGPALDLTSAETTLLKRLVDGATVTEAARDLGVSLETARTHVKRAYAKLGVSSREEMFAKISPFRMS